MTTGPLRKRRPGVHVQRVASKSTLSSISRPLLSCWSSLRSFRVNVSNHSSVQDGTHARGRERCRKRDRLVLPSEMQSRGHGGRCARQCTTRTIAPRCWPRRTTSQDGMQFNADRQHAARAMLFWVSIFFLCRPFVGLFNALLIFLCRILLVPTQLPPHGEYSGCYNGAWACPWCYSTPPYWQNMFERPVSIVTSNLWQPISVETGCSKLSR